MSMHCDIRIGEDIMEKKNGRIIILIVVGALGLILLIWGGIGSSSAGDVEQKETAPDPELYSAAVETEVVRICRGVVGNCGVDAVVSLGGGYRAVYASDSQGSSAGYKNSMVLVGSGSSEEAVLVCYDNPEITGIGIVISCPENDRVRREVISLVSAAFSVGTNKIYVAEAKK